MYKFIGLNNFIKYNINTFVEYLRNCTSKNFNGLSEIFYHSNIFTS